jgi:hypothetical protein
MLVKVILLVCVLLNINADIRFQTPVITRLHGILDGNTMIQNCQLKNEEQLKKECGKSHFQKTKRSESCFQVTTSC